MEITLTATVNPPQKQTITTWNQTFHEPLRVGDTIDLVPATINSGNTITYTSNNNAEIKDGKIIIKAAGNISITASHPGDREWQPVSETKTTTAYQYNVSPPTPYEVAYKYVKLSWSAIHEADSYDIYEGNTPIAKNIHELNYTISGLDYASTHTYTIKTNDAGSYTPQSSGTNITITTKPFPLVKNLRLDGEPGQNQVTIKWDHADLLENHELVEYLIHLYKEGETSEDEYLPGTNTSYTITGLTDATTYTAYIGVQYRQNLDGAVFHPVKVTEWIPIVITTKSFVPTTEHDGVVMYKGEWYRVMLNSTKTLVSGHHTYATNGTYEFDLKYPCNNLSYQAWLNKSANIVHSIHDNATNNTKELQKDPDYLDANRYNHSDAIDTSIKKVIFTGHQGGTGDKTIYLDNIYAKIAPHIIMSNDVNFDFTDTGETKGTKKEVKFHSFLTAGTLTYSIVNKDDDESNQYFKLHNTKTVGNNILCRTSDEDRNQYTFQVSFNPTAEKNGVYEARIKISDGTSTAYVNLSGRKYTHQLSWKNNFPTEILVGDIIEAPADQIKECGNDHIIEYSDPNGIFAQIEGYNYIYAAKEGETTLTAKIEGTDYCDEVVITRKIKVKEADPTMSWSQNLFFIQQDAEREVTLTAQSNKEGKIIYAIDGSYDNGIVSIQGDKLYIQPNAFGSVALKAYNENYPNIIARNTLVVNSKDDCNTIVKYDNTINTTVGISGTTTISLTYPTQSISFNADMGTAGHYYITVTDDKGNELLPRTKYTNDETITLALEKTVKTITIKTNPEWTDRLKVNSITTTLYSDFNNYEIKNVNTTDGIKFGEFNMGNGDLARPETVNLSYYSLPGGIKFEIDGDNSIFTLNKDNITNTCGIEDNSVTVTCNPNKRGEYKAYLVISTGGDEATKRIPLEAKIIGSTQTINWTNDTLTTVDKNVIIAKTNSDLPVFFEIIEGDCAEITNDGLTISINNKGTFSVKASHPGSNTYEPIEETKVFKTTIGTIRFDTEGNWNTTSNWLPVSDLNKQRNVAPSAVVNAEIAAEAKISSTNREEINNLTFVENGKLTIGATSGLKADTVNGATAKNLILESSAEGNATFIYNSGTPSATVEMYSKAENGILDHTDGKNTEWQYMGVAVNGAKVGDFKYDDSRNAWLLKWEESENTTGDPWSNKPLAGETRLVPWAGYSITQPDTTTYTMSGQLMNGDHTYTLTRTIKEGAEKQDPDCGFNLLANSYTAPIDITKLKEENFVHADSCIILYNTGTYADWETHTGTSGNQPGQLTVIPIVSAKAIDGDGLPTTIASMQAFFVMAQKDGATFTVDYETAVLGATNTGNQMRAPEARDEFNVLKIMIKGENSRDQLFLLENENTSKAYDNGYEARKIFDAPRGHQMYATCEYGYASIDCSKSFIGQAIGLKGDNEGEKLTISFGIDKIKDYESLFLYDKATGKYVNIMAEEEYTFYGIRGADDNRFCIVTNLDDRNQTPPFVVIGDELAFDKSQIGTDNANIYIYDTLGRLLMTDKVNPGENYRIPDMPEGIYLVSMNGYTTKIVRK